MSEPNYVHTFPNGLVLVAEPMDWLESAALTILVPAGSIHEPSDRVGLSGFICEMALRGAGERDSRKFIEDLDNLGVERGEAVSDAHTRYSGATVAANLPAALSILADVLRRPHLPADQLEAGRLVMLQELHAVEDEPSEKLMLELRRRHYPDPWGRPSQGDEEALESTTADDIRRHFARTYRPNGTIVGIAGRFEWPRVRDLVGELLGDWQPGGEDDVSLQGKSPARAHLEHDSNQVHIGIAYPSIPYRHPQYFQAFGAVSVLSGGMSARLFTEVRERRGLCYTVYASHNTLRDTGAVFCYAGSSADRAQETLDVTLGELVRLGKGVEEHELDRVKARVKSGLVMQQESSSSRSSSIARDWYLVGRVRPMDEVCRIVDGLSAGSINAYLAEHPPRDFTLVTLGPRELEATSLELVKP